MFERRLSRLAAFQKAARDNKMTYGELQVLETCGKVVVSPYGTVHWRRNEKNEKKA